MKIIPPGNTFIKDCQGGFFLQYNKVEICGVNTGKLKGAKRKRKERTSENYEGGK